MNLKLRKIIFIIITIFPYIAKGSILYPEPDKDQKKFANDIFGIKCPSQRNDKEIYLCALKIANRTQEDNKKAKEHLIYLSEKNILDAKYSLFLIRKNLGIDDKEASKYLVESAEKGLPEAQLELGIMYLKGYLFPQDKKQSYKWIKEAAEGNNYEGMKYLSKYYFSGTGIEQNDDLGFFWLRKLYEDYGPLFDDWDMLGTVYETGRGTPVDLVKAYMCYDLEGTAGIEEKARIAPQMTTEQRAEGLRLSHEWQEKNHVYTMQSLGLSRQKDGSYR
ncbi:tetratricopeptide repeat protein [Zymobacter sp. IVIA_5232.4 C2]|uniref:tetratricopeptide repeat protein n=1 Tax=Zymobacter sp. IVIA_5232.4 C2 TaxID=3394855 RepID=UPI0039C181D9